MSAPAPDAPDPLPAPPEGGLSTPDYRAAFEWAPVAMMVSRQRTIVDCNVRALQVFGASREQLVGASFEILYPSADEFLRTGERILQQLDHQGLYADDRVMRRVDGPAAGELFWCHVSGRALDPLAPHAMGIWTFEDQSAKRLLPIELTAREREVAALLIEGLTSKLIAKRLDISPRTVDVYRMRLISKHKVRSTPELVQRLLAR